MKKQTAGGTPAAQLWLSRLEQAAAAGEVPAAAVLLHLLHVPLNHLPAFDLTGVVVAAAAHVVAAVPLEPAARVVRVEPAVLPPHGQRLRSELHQKMTAQLDKYDPDEADWLTRRAGFRTKALGTIDDAAGGSFVPLPVLGGLAIVVFGLIAATAGRIWVENKVDFSQPKNLITVAATLIVGAGDLALPIGGFTLGGLGTAPFGAILLYHLLDIRKD